MRILTRVLLAVCWVMALVGCQSAQRAKSDTQRVEPPTEFREQVAQAFKDGRDLNLRDDAAWIATDAVTEAGLLEEVKNPDGYVVVADDGLYRVVFVQAADTGPLAAARVSIRPGQGKGVVSQMDYHPEGKPLTDVEAAHYRALTASRSGELQLCEGSYNTVVLPPGDGRGEAYHIYYLRAPTEPGFVPLAGHVLVRVNVDTFDVLEVRPLSTSCMMVEKKEERKTSALMMSNQALDAPSAAHAFLMWREELPLYMKARNGLLWVVDSTGIGLIK